jgi:phytoene/squalene synthetase
MAEARVRDSAGEPFADEGELWAYLDRTAGSLMWAAALALGAGPAAEPALRRFAQGAGLANWFCAVATLNDRGRSPLPDTSPDGIASLARQGLDQLSAAGQARQALTGPARWAMLPGWQAAGLLAQVAREPGRVTAGRLGLAEVRRRGGLLWHALRGGY